MGSSSVHPPVVLVAAPVTVLAAPGGDSSEVAFVLEALRDDLIGPKIVVNRGRIIGTPNSGLIAEFAEAVDAVRSAASIQDGIGRRNDAMAKEKWVEYRIGIAEAAASGDDAASSSTVALNLAGRAGPGTAFTTDAVRRASEAATDLVFRPVTGDTNGDGLGARPIFQVQLAEAKPEPVVFAGRTNHEPPQKPSIAVLPFANLSSESDRDYFADGIAEELITALSRIQWFFVIARNSSFAYRNRRIDARQVGRELGVRYILEGSVRRATDRVRITCQLIEADSARNIWADRYSGVVEDIFDLQDQIAESVIGAIEPKLRSAEIERARRKPPGRLDAYDLVLRALPHIHKFTADRMGMAKSLLDRALAAEPDYGYVLGLKAWCHTLAVSQRWSDDPEMERGQALEYGRAAVRVSRDDPETLAVAGYALAFFDEDPSDGLGYIDTSLELNPNAAQTWSSSGWVRTYNGDAVTAISHFDRACRQSPMDMAASRTYTGLAYAHMFLRKFDIAIDWAERAINDNENYLAAYRVLAASLGHLHRIEEGREVIRRMLQLTPKLTLEKALAGPVRHQPYAAITREGLGLVWPK